MRYLYLFLILVICASSSFADTQYSEVWFISGSVFDLDGITYELSISSRNSNILVKNLNTPGLSAIYSLGDCLENSFRKVCFTERDSSVPRIKGVFYQKDISIQGIVSASTYSQFIGDTIDLTFTLQHDKSINISNAQLKVSFPQDILLISPNNCEISQGNLLTANITSPEHTCEVTISSDTPTKYTVIGEISYSVEQTQFVNFTSTYTVEFKPHFGYDVVMENISLSDPFFVNLSFGNNFEEELDYNLTIFIPEGLKLLNKRKFSEIKNESGFSNVLNRITSLNTGERTNFSLELEVDTPGSYVILMQPTYTLGSKKYSDIERILISVTVPENYTAPLVTCDENVFNITATLNTTNQYYPGESLYFLVYAQNNAQFNVSNVSLSFFENSVLTANNFWDIIQSKHKVALTQAYTKIDGAKEFLVNITFTCQGEILSEDVKLIANISDIKEIVIIKNISKTSVYPGEKINVSVSAENLMDVPISTISFSETIPSLLSIQGTTKNIVSLGAKKKEAVYTYTVTAPNTPGNYSLETIATYSIGGKATISKFNTLFIVNSEPIQLEYAYSIEADKKYPFQPSEIKFILKNNHPQPIENLYMSLSSSHLMDIGTNSDFTFSSLLPKQIIEHIFPVIFKESNLDLSGTLYFEYKGEKKQLDVPVTVDLSNTSGINVLNLSYTVEKNHALDGTTRFTYFLENPSLLDIDYNFLFDSIPRKILAGSSESYTFVLDKNTPDLQVAYTFFGQSYYLAPKSVSENTETQIQTPSSDYSQSNQENQPASSLNGEENIEISLEEKNFRTILVYGFIGLLFFIFMTIGVLALKPKNIKKKENVIPNLNNVPKKVISFNEYDQLRKNLEIKK